MFDMKEFLKFTGRYITESSKHASDFYASIDFNHEMFEGMTIGLTPKMCEDIYVELIKDMHKNNHLVAQRMGLSAFIIPVQLENQVAFNLQLGVIFPHRKNSNEKQEDSSIAADFNPSTNG